MEITNTSLEHIMTTNDSSTSNSLLSPNYLLTSVVAQGALLATISAEQRMVNVVVVGVLGMVVAVGVMGNLLVLAAYRPWSRDTSLSSAVVFILMMAVMDLASCLLSVPYEILDLLKPYDNDNVQLCQACRFVTTVLSQSRGLMLLCVAWDRYLKICLPLSTYSSRRAKAAVMIVLLLGVVLGWPQIMLNGQVTIQTHLPHVQGTDCNITQRLYALLYHGLLYILFLVSFLIYAILYGRIFYVLWQNGWFEVSETPESRSKSSKSDDTPSRVMGEEPPRSPRHDDVTVHSFNSYISEKCDEHVPGHSSTETPTHISAISLSVRSTPTRGEFDVPRRAALWVSDNREAEIGADELEMSSLSSSAKKIRKLSTAATTVETGIPLPRVMTDGQQYPNEPAHQLRTQNYLCRGSCCCEPNWGSKASKGKHPRAIYGCRPVLKEALMTMTGDGLSPSIKTSKDMRRSYSQPNFSTCDGHVSGPVMTYYSTSSNITGMRSMLKSGVNEEGSRGDDNHSTNTGAKAKFSSSQLRPAHNTHFVELRTYAIDPLGVLSAHHRRSENRSVCVLKNHCKFNTDSWGRFRKPSRRCLSLHDIFIYGDTGTYAFPTNSQEDCLKPMHNKHFSRRPHTGNVESSRVSDSDRTADKKTEPYKTISQDNKQDSNYRIGSTYFSETSCFQSDYRNTISNAFGHWSFPRKTSSQTFAEDEVGKQPRRSGTNKSTASEELTGRHDSNRTQGFHQNENECSVMYLTCSENIARPLADQPIGKHVRTSPDINFQDNSQNVTLMGVRAESKPCQNVKIVETGTSHSVIMTETIPSVTSTVYESSTDKTSRTVTEVPPSEIGFCSSQFRRHGGKRLRLGKTTIMLALVTLSTVLGFVPCLTVMVMRTSGIKFQNQTSSTGDLAYMFCIRSFFLNNIINPFLYFYVNPHFRQKVRHILHGVT